MLVHCSGLATMPCKTCLSYVSTPTSNLWPACRCFAASHAYAAGTRQWADVDTGCRQSKAALDGRRTGWVHSKATIAVSCLDRALLGQTPAALQSQFAIRSPFQAMGAVDFSACAAGRSQHAIYLRSFMPVISPRHALSFRKKYLPPILAAKRRSRLATVS